MGAWRLPDWVAVLPSVRIAHAVVGSLTVLFVFPAGGIVLRLWDHDYCPWVHAGIQMFGYLLYLATAAMGIWMGAVEKKVRKTIALTCQPTMSGDRLADG